MELEFHLWKASLSKVWGETVQLGDLYQAAGKLREALAFYRASLDIADWSIKIHAEYEIIQQLSLSLSYRRIGLLLQAQGDLAVAQPLLERALAVVEGLGANDLDTASDLENLGLVHQAQGDFKGARTLLERALANWEALYGPDHPITALGLNNLARLHQDEGDATGARPFFERAGEIYAKIGNPLAVANALRDHDLERAKMENLRIGVEFKYSPIATFYSKRKPLSSRGHKTLQNDTGEQNVGLLQDEKAVVSPEDGLEGLGLFLRAFAGSEKVDEPDLAEASLVAAKKKVTGRPIWDERKRYHELRHLNAARFVRAVYHDLIEGHPHLPDGRSIWHLLLPGGHPVWQEAVRFYDAKAVQMLQVYVNGRPGDDLGDAEGLIFEKKINRMQPKRPKRKSAKGVRRYQPI